MIDLMRFSRPLTGLDALEVCDPIAWVQAKLKPVTDYLTTVKNILRAIVHLRVVVDDAGTIILVHAPTETSMILRADGNLNVWTRRNYFVRTNGVLLLNCSPEFDMKMNRGTVRPKQPDYRPE